MTAGKAGTILFARLALPPVAAYDKRHNIDTKDEIGAPPRHTATRKTKNEAKDY
jgi:hypothetical protein